MKAPAMRVVVAHIRAAAQRHQPTKQDTVDADKALRAAQKARNDKVQALLFKAVKADPTKFIDINVERYQSLTGSDTFEKLEAKLCEQFPKIDRNDYHTTTSVEFVSLNTTVYVSKKASCKFQAAAAAIDSSFMTGDAAALVGILAGL